MILNNNLTSAINCLTKAMSLNPSDYRHYLNRSYCYLRVEKPSYALSDAQTVIQSTKNLGFLFMANLRAGQSEHILKKYPQSETFLREALSIYPDSPHAQRELLRVQIARIMEHDHPEKHAIFALEKFNSTADAIKYLKDNYIPKGNDSEPETFLFDSEYDNQVIDESNMENSYAEALNRLMTVRPETKLRHVAQPFLSWLRPSSSGSDKSKTSSNTSLYGKNVQVTQNAVWVGNLTEQITEQMIKKAFRSYGPVLSVHRPEGKAFGFVNFEKTEDATKLLKNTGSVNINGIECLLRAAIRKD
ncbi:uncharacterized protein LOC106639141 [Copidosoma floridanum]|uniref:uncharacterized protein LOC106639141 n=1 Tax=Copidosoma floridanum TaxID=29053 RepID=UPI0006C9B8B7|nr:uncharacterized protein LOC106639141 [Copidosoma floridanum]